MKNSIIAELVAGGIKNISTTTIPASQAYKVYKFKRAIEKAHEAIIEAHRDILKQYGIEDLQEFQKRHKELSDIKERNAEEQAELDALKKKDLEAGKLIQELYADTTEIEAKAIPYDNWHDLQAENKDAKVLTYLEPILEGILWVAPSEEA